MGDSRRKCSIDLKLLIESTFLSDGECETLYERKPKRIKVHQENFKFTCNNCELYADNIRSSNITCAFEDKGKPKIKCIEDGCQTSSKIYDKICAG